MRLIQPWGKRVLINPVSIERLTEGGILMPVVGAGDSICGEILAVGDECQKAKPGMIVHFHRMAALVVPGSEGPNLILDEGSIQGSENKAHVKILSREEVRKYEEKRISEAQGPKIVTPAEAEADPEVN